MTKPIDRRDSRVLDRGPGRRAPTGDPRRARRTRRRWVGPLALALALLPALGVALQAAADEDGDAPRASAQEAPADETPWEARARVLKAMPADPAVLINVTDREMPASPDILNLGKRGTLALARCLSDNVDANLRMTCGMLLGELGDPRALPALVGALEDWEPAVRAEVIDALAKIPDASSLDPLVKLYRRKDEDAGNRARLLATLGALSQPRAVALLRAELRKKPEEDQPDLRPAAFRALWMSRHLVARATLEADVAGALGSDNEGLALAATEAAAELRAARLVTPLTPLLEHRNAEIRNKAVYALGLIGDRSAARALLAKLPGVRDARMLNNIAFALERLDRDAFYASIRQVIEHKQAIIRLNAAFVLGDVKRPEGLPLLEKALGDPSDYVKTSAVVALGKLGTDRAIAPLERFVDAPNLSIRQEAIYALHALTGGKRADLIHDKLFNTTYPGVRHRAAMELARAGDRRVRDYVLQCLEQRACPVGEIEGYLRQDRAPAVGGRVLLSWARGNEDLSDVLADLRPPGTLPLAVSSAEAALARSDTSSAKRAIDLVGDLGDASARERLAGKVSDTDAWLRVHVGVALARLGDTTADATLLRDLDNFPAAWLPSFAGVLRRIAEPAVRARFTPELARREKDRDMNVALASAAVHLGWDPEGAFFRLLDGLASKSSMERDLAALYLRKDRSQQVTWLLRRALARERREDVRDRLRELLVGRS